MQDCICPVFLRPSTTATTLNNQVLMHPSSFKDNILCSLPSFVFLKIRETTDVLARRVHQMEVDLEGEVKEREALAKQLRKTEKSLSETAALMTEAQESEESLKGKVSVTNYVSSLFRPTNWKI